MRRANPILLAAACGAAFAGSIAAVVAVLPAPTVRTVAVEPPKPQLDFAQQGRELDATLALARYYEHNNDPYRQVKP